MRITSVMMGRNYKNSLQSAQAKLNKASQTAENYKKFQTVADDPASAAKGFQLRKELTRLEAHKSNAEMADGRLKTAESSMVNVQDQLKDVKDRLIQGNNSGTLSKEDREIIAKELRGIQEAIMQDMNVSYTDQYLFGGSKTDKPPLSVSEDGKLLYRGEELDYDPESMTEEEKKAFDERIASYGAEEILVDFGFGLEVGNSQSGFDVSLSAVDLLGAGVDPESGMSNNLFNLIGEMADYLEKSGDDYDADYFGGYIEHFDDRHAKFLDGLTAMGQKSNAIKYTLERLGKSEQALQEKQNYVEAVAPEEALQDWKWQEFAYRSALSIGTKILQPSLLDYIN